MSNQHAEGLNPRSLPATRVLLAVVQHNLWSLVLNLHTELTLLVSYGLNHLAKRCSYGF